MHAIQPAHDTRDELHDVDPITANLAAVIRELGPGHRLPSERDLAVRLGVSRTALRDRLQHAEAVGLIRRSVGSGTYVEQINPQGLADGLQLALAASQLDIRELHPVRVALERQAARDAASSGVPAPIAEMNRALEQMAVAGAPPAMADADALFHRALMDAPGNPAMSFFGQALATVRRDAMRHRTEQLTFVARDDPEFMLGLHRPIYEAIVAGTPDEAAARVDAHFAEFTEAVTQAGFHPYSE